MTTTLPPLESSLAEITQLIDAMEHQNLTLENALTHFERGITLIKHCQQLLTQAEQKVQILLQQNGQANLGNYEGSSLDDNAGK